MSEILENIKKELQMATLKFLEKAREEKIKNDKESNAAQNMAKKSNP